MLQPARLPGAPTPPHLQVCEVEVGGAAARLKVGHHVAHKAAGRWGAEGVTMEWVGGASEARAPLGQGDEARVALQWSCSQRASQGNTGQGGQEGAPRGHAAVKPQARGDAVDGAQVHHVLELAARAQYRVGLHQPLHACGGMEAGRRAGGRWVRTLLVLAAGIPPC